MSQDIEKSQHKRKTYKHRFPFFDGDEHGDTEVHAHAHAHTRFLAQSARNHVSSIALDTRHCEGSLDKTTFARERV